MLLGKRVLRDGGSETTSEGWEGKEAGRLPTSTPMKGNFGTCAPVDGAEPEADHRGERTGGFELFEQRLL